MISADEPEWWCRPEPCDEVDELLLAGDCGVKGSGRIPLEEAAAVRIAASLLAGALLNGHTSMASGLCACLIYSCANKKRAMAWTSTASASDRPAGSVIVCYLQQVNCTARTFKTS